MHYSKFGNTNFEISSLGFGAMRLPMLEKDGKQIINQDSVDSMMKKAFDLGVNYFDTAYFYNDGLSENSLGRAVKPFRNKIKISSKSPSHLVKNAGDYTKFLDEQLKRLDMDYIDFYHFHGIGFNSFNEIDKKTNWLNEAYKAKDSGLIKHISFSFHDKPENMIKLIDLGIFDSVLCQYNVIDRSNEEAIKYAKSKGLGVVVMGPVGGGRISGLPKDISDKLNIKVASNVELALRFVFSNPNIDCALSGMENIDMVEENSQIASNKNPLSHDELNSLNEMMEENAKLSELYCTGCNYCMPCPEKINIPHIFRMMNYYKVYGMIDYSKKGYAEIGTNPWVVGKRADSCTKCGICETKCPQKLKIREQLEESHRALG